jgi:hypothetical protein
MTVEEMLIGFIYTFLIVISFQSIFSKIFDNASKHRGKKILILAIQCLIISLYFTRFS